VIGGLGGDFQGGGIEASKRSEHQEARCQNQIFFHFVWGYKIKDYVKYKQTVPFCQVFGGENYLLLFGLLPRCPSGRSSQ
jgi:hypothetical protein